MVQLALGIAVLLAFAAGCAGGQQAQPRQTAAPPATTSPMTGASPGPPATEALCSAATDFQNAANALLQLNASQLGVEGVRAALQRLQTTGAALATAAQDYYGPQAQQLRQALDALGTTASSLSDQASLSSKLGELAGAVAAVEAAARPIVDGARTSCRTVPSAELPTT